MSRGGWAALPHGDTGLSAVCDCGISWSYSLTIPCVYVKVHKQTCGLFNITPLAAEGAMCTFHTFEKNACKDLQPPEKSGLQYKCLVLILKIVYECIVSNESRLKQIGDNSLYPKEYSQFFGMKRCNMSHSTFCNQ